MNCSSFHQMCGEIQLIEHLKKYQTKKNQESFKLSGHSVIDPQVAVLQQ